MSNITPYTVLKDLMLRYMLDGGGMVLDKNDFENIMHAVHQLEGQANDEPKTDATEYYEHLKTQVGYSKDYYEKHNEDMSARAWYEALNWSLTEFEAMVKLPEKQS
jgi:hypothetical protein